MKIELPEEIKSYIEAELAAGPYKTPAELIAALVLRNQAKNVNEHRLWERQHQSIDRLLAELPDTSAADGLTGRDHDRIIYGE